MSQDDLGDRMKDHEKVETGRKLDPSLPIYARIDGHGFSKFTRGMDRPFDQRMTDAMIAVTAHLVKKTHAVCGYVQSDEISLVWPECGEGSAFMFNGKLQKMTSLLAAAATDRMNKIMRDWSPYNDREMEFDCRAINLPSRTEATNMMLWRNVDASKNAVSMACRSTYSSKQMHKKSSAEMIEMMSEKGIIFSDYPSAFRNGTFVRRKLRTFEAVNKSTDISETVTRAEIVSVSYDNKFQYLPHEQREELIFGIFA